MRVRNAPARLALPTISSSISSYPCTWIGVAMIYSSLGHYTPIPTILSSCVSRVRPWRVSGVVRGESRCALRCRCDWRAARLCLQPGQRRPLSSPSWPTDLVDCLPAHEWAFSPQAHCVCACVRASVLCVYVCRPVGWSLTYMLADRNNGVGFGQCPCASSPERVY
jgi:hypothetical protein